MIQVALVGCGHMGMHHARVVSEHPGCRLVAAVDARPERARAIAERFDSEAREAVPDGAEVIVIATPTTTHASVARPLLREGRWCLVEKPLVASLEDAEGWEGVERLAVGHVERFNPAVRALGQSRPGRVEATRVAPPTHRSLEIDVVQDLMIHDLDLLSLWTDLETLVVENARGTRGPSGRLDEVTATLRGEHGLVCRLEASRVARRAERRIRLFGPSEFVSLDLQRGVAQSNGRRLPRCDERDGLEAQWAVFIDAVRGRCPLPVSAVSAISALRAVERVRGAIGQ